ncbi:MAG: hypothetical protein AUJ04_00085 [Acidobacteria bacterium 13_1_40CM_3_55_6]|nr:MAG: hypothetical protein AUJ04_00085 [Acidobacteria bacterium 13_1_40CM_3_55_6]
MTAAELRWRLVKPEAQPLQSGAQDFVASAADTCARCDSFRDVLFAFPEAEAELVPSIGPVCVRLTIKSARRDSPQSVSDSPALRWTWTPFPERTGELHEPCAQEPAECGARPAQQASLHIEPADPDAMGTLIDRSAHTSDAARIGLAVWIEEKRAVLVRIFKTATRRNASG